MKHRISITLDEETVFRMKEAVRVSPVFRNQSHFVEVAIKEKVESDKDE
ncbi:hypothetical protein GF361_02480 [Candidatus Woesearchaeota archaeon]|nr:hypothetical protein [Candidatus Woesearchaeota archaeon]